MKFIIGLGNPGTEYENTRHNLGRRVVMHYARYLNALFKKDRFAFAQKAQAVDDSEDVILVLPETFMNLSGRAVRALLDSKVESTQSSLNELCSQDLCVVVDDLETPWGDVRMKFTGGTSGHNGLKSIHKELGINSYAQLRVGIGRPEGLQPVVDYVLDTFSKDEIQRLPQVLEKSVEVLRSWCRGDLSPRKE